MAQKASFDRIWALLQADFEIASDTGTDPELQYDDGRPCLVLFSSPETLVGDCDRLLGVLEANGVGVAPIEEATPGNGKVSIQGCYDPADQTAVVLVVGLDDSKLPE